MVNDVQWFVGIDWATRAIAFACWMPKEDVWGSASSPMAELG